ncbi:MAG: hypothetical protein A3H57_02130 [Candidatus Taylorbacteria bacterium RIFCSPLOWO2_02_FULL_43_11]|uniref:Uncharacterized protein n=1 Tax=Candidatus Taylorbacteria bacterium RIFCSPHIGHO2_02_FULL_43_32b TaxID=1802306 RepID=A0A1G2MGT0_9BACT|nr:MAG: hypothetical protein A2743_00505 [Candidatus Taylorbacteria bacterium RIFCSPHIGHO2_01_FULL_43_47]OHA23077.1 MAG: hypothetical protein A3C72_02020 [Candidatus Taylorbacteria bacterium RIFCSPHIGHO2_02_FULL_43_32b]OHA29954.1 MAG: hypothetical protein A3B08_02185 [Candidatus Taylorbacteria bacterium RIFCSPLOWO2_01_FULL_43_44]OHA36559.1 MAG: hypothetical protein A3H57_02130 [Candidatus Taylorbacteria bacterium RIFCSPLOWO2_02_FULL_43_11]
MLLYLVIHLKDKDIFAFQTLYKKHFGVEISNQQALENGLKLLRLMEIVYKPMTLEDLDAVRVRQKVLLTLKLRTVAGKRSKQ